MLERAARHAHGIVGLATITSRNAIRPLLSREKFIDDGLALEHFTDSGF